MKMKRFVSKIRNGERGQSLVELAISLVFLLLLLSGTIDLGRAFFTYITLRDAAQEGAIYASYQPTCTDQIIARVHGAATSPVDTAGIVMSSADISLPDGAVPGKTITIRVNYNFDITMPLLGAFTGQVVPITATVTNTILKIADSPCS
ncbi:MAG: TadE/TadG family type IV pilus assembly protein [Anaerolineaceae bacterium]|nr:TadE/TadG family type IV pilus assembly protein [Anaerolineaceae bacterium]